MIRSAMPIVIDFHYFFLLLLKLFFFLHFLSKLFVKTELATVGKCILSRFTGMFCFCHIIL